MIHEVNEQEIGYKHPLGIFQKMVDRGRRIMRKGI